jgi:hypothetical protein
VGQAFAGARRAAGEEPRVWITAMDAMTLPKIAGVATALILLNPVDPASLIGLHNGVLSGEGRPELAEYRYRYHLISHIAIGRILDRLL